MVELIYVSFWEKKKIESAIFDLSSSKIDAKGAFCFQFFGSFWGKEVCVLLGLKGGFHYKKGASLRNDREKQ